MKYEDIERQPFEEFGEIEAIEAPETQEESHEIELSQSENAIEIETVEPVAPSSVKTPFSWAGFSGGLAALVWIGGAIGGPLSYYGVDAVMAMDPAMQAGLIALAFGPAILFWLAAAAAGEAMKARSLAVELTRMAQDARLPSDAGELQAQKLSNTVKVEIEALNDAVAAALNRLAELETVAQRNTHMFDSAIAATRENANYMAGHLARERDALMELNGEMRGQTETMAQSIGRQLRLMREASKLVKTEMNAAEDALEHHLASFAASASVMAERTSAFHGAAENVSHATGSLNVTMSQMLDGLGEATQLTDAARKSTEQAVLAANETAAAVRDTTRNAVFEAKRAAQLIRAETAALQDAAAETLAKLQSAANAAREASEESQAAADRHSASIERRLSALASTAGAVRKPAAAAPAPQTVRQVQSRPVEHKPEPAHAEETALYAAANAAVSRGASPRSIPTLAVEPRQAKGFKGLGGWGNFLPQTQPKAANAPEQADAFELADFGERRNPDSVLKTDACDLVATAGVDLDDVLQPSDLERIAQQSRHGALARRRAVAEAAPAAVGRIARHVKRNSDARLVAAEFRSRPDLAKSEKNVVRAYLLIDAALA